MMIFARTHFERRFLFRRPTPSNIITYGICGPAACSPAMLSQIVKETLDESSIDYVLDISIAPVTCQRKVKTEFRASDIISM